MERLEFAVTDSRQTNSKALGYVSTRTTCYGGNSLSEFTSYSTIMAHVRSLPNAKGEGKRLALLQSENSS